ncbi:MAG TPA: SDR family oxidoreductase [Blastocatellia bacterium]|nr:SDR family oxidoreductase [Blastocatellia bacterium]
MMKANQILITGGDGYLGRRLATRYLEQTDSAVVLWMRAADEQEFRAKRENLARAFEEFGPRVSFLHGDLVNDEPFESVDSTSIQKIIHAASVIRFNVDQETARRVNIEGTERLLRFAGGCKNLEAFALLSTVYASGLRPGVIEEAQLDCAAGFANFYEQSKWASEAMLMREFDHLPWQVFRVATVIADSGGGHVTQYNAFHNTLKLFYYGLLSLIPGVPDTPVYFVTGDFVADSVFELMSAREGKTIYHVSHTQRESLTLGELIDAAFEVFEQDEDFRMRRVLKPLYSDAESFDILVDGISAFGGGIVNQAVSSVAPFGKQLFIKKDILNSNLASGLRDYRAPDARSLMLDTCRYLVKTRWGKRDQHG